MMTVEVIAGMLGSCLWLMGNEVIYHLVPR